MDIAHGVQFGTARLQPAVTGVALTVRAVAVAARVVGDGAQSALRTCIHMTAESCRAAALDGAQRFEVLPVEATQAAVEESRSGSADDIGHLQRRPVHGSMPEYRG